MHVDGKEVYGQSLSSWFDGCRTEGAYYLQAIVAMFNWMPLLLFDMWHLCLLFLYV